MKKKLYNFFEGMAGAFIMLFAVLTPFLRIWRTRWGATKAEVKNALPGDELIKNPKWQYTQAITVKTPPDKVWPWLVQMGQNRGGFYSYQGLENLLGCNIHNADRIIPEYQHLEVGDNVLLAPEVPYPVAQVEPGRSIVLYVDTRKGVLPISGGKSGFYFEGSWLFHIKARGNDSTRLISRFRLDYGRGIFNRISCGYFIEPLSSTMQQQMLRGIKKRVEKAVR